MNCESWCFILIFNCSEICGRNSQTYIRWLTPMNKIPATDIVGPAQPLPHRCRTFPLLLCIYGVWPLLQPASVAQKINRSPCCLPIPNPSTSPWIARPDHSGWWDNWLSAQHLPKDLVRPSSGLKELLQTMKMKQLVLVCCRHSHLNRPHCSVFYLLNKLIGIKSFVFFPTVFPPQFLPGAHFLPGIKHSSLSEPSCSRLRTTGREQSICCAS